MTEIAGTGCFGSSDVGGCILQLSNFHFYYFLTSQLPHFPTCFFPIGTLDPTAEHRTMKLLRNIQTALPKAGLLTTVFRGLLPFGEGDFRGWTTEREHKTPDSLGFSREKRPLKKFEKTFQKALDSFAGGWYTGGVFRTLKVTLNRPAIGATCLSSNF